MSLLERLRAQAGDRCGYCRSSSRIMGQPLSIEHIIPRQQHWRDHFAWSGDGLRIIGLTPAGRATVIALQLNNPIIVAARALWVSVGWHPPAEE